MLPRAKKSYGQNFLVDETVVQKILAAAEIKPGEAVLEVGPGTGVLTRALVDAGARVVAVEADRDLIAGLKKAFGETITLIEGDALALRAPLPFENRAYKLVANIPYNITSQLLEHFFTTSPRPSRMVLMLQKEVADRLTAAPGDMSLLSVVCQLYARVERMAVVKAGAFRPMPKVDSAIVRFDLYPNVHPEAVIALAKRGFAARRKQLKSNLGAAVVPTLERMDLPKTARAQELSAKQWIELSLGLS
ncbi:ribosomal RNA small subunit methyltransferase A [Candidatus Uhrbacteria bacterium]|nr:ribosomal RNA small subunit methyltransferase A [Candidatus Uhrbacteria bacterium]